MYSYAVVGYFDEITENIFKSYSNHLNENKITDYVVNSKGKRPHITIADYDDLNKSEFIDYMIKFYKNKESIDISFNVLGTFIETGTLFVSPATSKALLDFHKVHHTNFINFKDNNQSLYLPEGWFPHCTIASRLDDRNMLKAIE